VKQVWYVEDSSALRSLAGMKKWWKYLQTKRPDFGHCPKPAKTIHLIKDNSLMQSSQKLFKILESKSQTKGMPTWISNWDRIIH